MNENNTNLIFQIIGAIGSLATFGAFMFLFRRDKDKQTQIDKLTNIATILDAQNDTMKLQNDLIAQQVNIVRNTSLLKDQDSGALTELRKIEEKRLKLSVKPNLWLNGAGYSGYDGEMHIDLNNKGEDATILGINLTSDDIVLHDNPIPFMLEKGEHRNILGRQRGDKHIQYCEYEVDIIYADKLDNKYLVKIKGKGATVKIIENQETE